MVPETLAERCQGQRLGKHPWSRCNRIGVVWLVASCWQMLISVCWDWALALGSTRSSSCLAAEVHSFWCRLVGGIMLADADLCLLDWALALGSTRSSSCLATEVQTVKLLGGRNSAVG